MEGGIDITCYVENEKKTFFILFTYHSETSDAIESL